MKLYFIYRKNPTAEFDTYDSMVVCAENETEALQIHPRTEFMLEFDEASNKECWENGAEWWVKNTKSLNIEYLGEATENLKKGVINTSFYAG